MEKIKKLINLSILHIILVIPFIIQSQIIGQENNNKNQCLTSKFKFDNSSIEKIVMHPEDILEEPNKFWDNDSAYQLVKLWHKRVSFPIEETA